MPSPTDSTWPTSVTSASASKLRISRFRIAEISEGWMSISGAFHGGTQAVELGAQGRIDHARADPHNESAKQLGVDIGGEFGSGSEFVPQHAAQFAGFVGREFARRSDLRGNLAAMTREQSLEGADDVGKREQSALLRE